MAELNEISHQDVAINLSNKEMEEHIRVYRKRWAILLIFSACNMWNSFHWLQYATIAHLTSKYYSVSTWIVDYLALIYMIFYVIFIIPAAYLLSKKGLRITVFLGSFSMFIGSWIKVMSVSSDGFYVTFLGQCFLAISFVFLFGVPPNLAAVWFGMDQVSTASALGVMSAEVGVALGFVIPTYIVSEQVNLTTIGSQLQILFYVGAVVSTVIFLLVCIFFQNKPPVPPSKANALANNEEEKKNYKLSLKNIMSNKGFLLLLAAYAIFHAVLTSIITLLDQIISAKFFQQGTFSGWLGNANTCATIIGGIMIGVWLDKTHSFRASTIGLCAISTVGMIMFTLSVFYSSGVLCYITFIFTGLSSGAYTSLGYEYGIELTYPEPEGTTSGILNMACFLLSIPMTMFGGFLLRTWGDLATNLLFSSLLGVGTLFAIFIHGDYKRLGA